MCHSDSSFFFFFRVINRASCLIYILTSPTAAPAACCLPKSDGWRSFVTTFPVRHRCTCWQAFKRALNLADTLAFTFNEKVPENLSRHVFIWHVATLSPLQTPAILYINSLTKTSAEVCHGRWLVFSHSWQWPGFDTRPISELTLV